MKTSHGVEGTDSNSPAAAGDRVGAERQYPKGDNLPTRSHTASGYYDTDGNYSPFREPIPVFRFGDSYRDKDGMAWAVKDEYGDWVNPHLKRIGMKSIIKIESGPDEEQVSGR